jgi:hypothetical protein
MDMDMAFLYIVLEYIVMGGQVRCHGRTQEAVAGAK